MANRQFHRYTSVTFSNVSINSDDLTVEFNIPFDKDAEPNEGTITVYNLSQNTRNNIKKDDKVTVNAGYQGDVGVVLEGYVSSVETNLAGPDKATTISVLDAPSPEEPKTVEKTYEVNVKADKIVNDLLPKLGLPIGRVNSPRNPYYATGYTAEGEIKDVLTDIAADCGVSFYVNRGKAHFHWIHDGKDADTVVLNAESGLIGSPQPFENDRFSGYRIECLLNHRITTGTIVDLQSKYVSGKFYVISGTMRKNSNDFIVSVEAIV